MWTETWGAIDITTENSGSYTIQKWDTLWVIAKKSGISLEELMKWNSIKNPNMIRVGEKLQINSPEKIAPVNTDSIAFGQQRALWYAWRNDVDPAWTIDILNDELARLFPGMTIPTPKASSSFVTPEPINFGTRIQRNTETLIRFPYTADDFYSERNPVRLWVVHAELMNYATRGGTIEKLSPEIRKTLIEAISRVSATYDGGVNEINRPNISLANDALIRNPENVELVQLSWGDIQFRLKSDPTLHTFGYNSAQGIYGLKNIRS